MAITVNSNTKTTGMPSAPVRMVILNVDLDATSILNGYDVSAQVPGLTLKHSAWVPHYDGSTLRWFRLYTVSGVVRLQAFTNNNGAPGSLVGAGVDLSNHTGLEVVGWFQ